MVAVDDVPLSRQQQLEHLEAARNLDPASIGQGYLCSTFDPILCLVSQLTAAEIRHLWRRAPCFGGNVEVVYRREPGLVIELLSTMRHMYGRPPTVKEAAMLRKEPQERNGRGAAPAASAGGHRADSSGGRRTPPASDGPR
eukprot:gene31856-28705_t